MTVTNFPQRDKRRNRAAHLAQILNRRVREDAAWAKFRLAVVRFHQNPSPARHVEAHTARCAWERAW